MMKYCFVRVWLTFGIIPLFALIASSQVVNGDSLMALLRQHNAVDALTAERMQGLSAYYSRLKPDSSLYFAEKSLEIGVAIKDDKLIGTAKYLKGVFLLGQQENEAARAWFDEAILLFQATGDRKKLMKVYSNYGVSYTNQTNIVEARKWIEKAMVIARELQDYEAQASITMNQGVLADLEGDKEEAVNLYTQALRYYEKSGGWGAAAIVHHNIGALLSNMEDQPNAIIHTKEAIRLYRQVHNNKSLTNALLNLAYYYLESDSLVLAAQYLQEAESLPIRQNPVQKAQWFLTKAQIEEKKLNFPTAISLSDSCIYYAQRIGSAINLHNGKSTLARIQIAQKKYRPALSNSLEALQIALQISDAVSINLDQKLAAESAKGLGKSAEAVVYYSAYEAGRDTLYTQERFQAIRNVERKYEAEKKEATIKSQQDQLKSQKVMLVLAIAIIVLFAILGYVLFQRGKERQRELIKSNQMRVFLEEQNSVLTEMNVGLRKKLTLINSPSVSDSVIREWTVSLSNKEKTLLKIGDIIFIESNGNFVTFHTHGGIFHDWQALDHYEDLLAPSTLFKRTHRSYIVNRLHIVGKKATELKLSNGRNIAIASTPATKAAVHAWLDLW